MKPTYAMYPVYCQMFGAAVDELTFDENLNLSFETVLAKATPEVKLFALVNPNQPIESCFSLDELRALAEKCAENNTLLLIDEAYHHFCKITGASLVNDFPNVIIARTFSKAFGLAGLRIGYLISSASVIISLRALKHIYEINGLNAAVLNYFLKRPQIMESYVNDVNEGRALLTKFFSDRK